MQFGFCNLVGPENHVLHGGPDRPMRMRIFRGKDMPGIFKPNLPIAGEMLSTGSRVRLGTH